MTNGEPMMNLNWLIDGPNLAFALPLVLALVYLGLYVASGVTFGDPDIASDVDADVDADVHADVHPSGMVHDLSPRDGGDGEASPAFNVLSWFGVGRVPISLWLSGAMLGWGVFGLSAASLMQRQPIDPTLTVPLAFAVAVVGGLVATRLLTVVVTKIVPIHETYAKRRHELLGSEGEAIYPIDATFGMVGVRDDRGEFFQVSCRAEDGVGPIAKGTRVKLVGYNRETMLYHVVPAGENVRTTSAA